MKGKRIWCENAIDRMWGLFIFFENEPSAKDLLFSSYIQLEEEKEATRLAFDNTHKFIYFLKQGASYFKSAQQSELIVRPLLLYYGFTSLMKAIILLKDPYYPRTTSVLQHGITTRKKKKNNYIFHEDEIKVQKHGLLPHFAHFALAQPLTLHSKYKVIDLLSIIPELRDSFYLLYQRKTLLPISVEVQDNLWTIKLSHHELKHHGVELEHIDQLMKEGLSFPAIEVTYSPQQDVHHYVLKAVDHKPIEQVHSQICTDYKGNYYFYYPKLMTITNEIIILNMLMYILGMLCRYDTELWGEILFTFSSSDKYMIEECLQLAFRKFPNLVLNYLFNETLLFET